MTTAATTKTEPEAASPGAGTGAEAQLRASRRRPVVVAACLAGLSILAASAAWACEPGHDNRTLIQSCGAPTGATKACKPMVGSEGFPKATAVKGPAGSRLWAYVPSGPMLRNSPYDLMFASSAVLANGGDCHKFPSAAIGGPVLATGDGTIPATRGTIPTDAPLGKGQICFSDAPAHTSAADDPGHIIATESLPATFKVII